VENRGGDGDLAGAATTENAKPDAAKAMAEQVTFVPFAFAIHLLRDETPLARQHKERIVHKVAAIAEVRERDVRSVRVGAPARLRTVLVVAATAAIFLLLNGGKATGGLAAPPRWAYVFAHPSPADEVIGLDVARSGTHSTQILTRRPKGTHEADGDASWSPDGKYLAFARLHQNAGLYLVRADGGSPRRLLSSPDVQDIAWSPDGKLLAFARCCTTIGETDVIRVDGTGFRRVYPDSSDSGPASWSPDGQKLVCLCSGRIISFDVNGGGVRHLSTRSEGDLGSPSWSPDGTRIAYGRHCTIGPIGGGCLLRPRRNGCRRIG
jgi:hypothetical protein